MMSAYNIIYPNVLGVCRMLAQLTTFNDVPFSCKSPVP